MRRAPWRQLDLFSAAGGVETPAAPPAAPRWRWTRPWLVSPHRPRAERELDRVRDAFPELAGTTVTIGLTRRRAILGLAAMGDVPTIWLRPRRISRFVIAHEFVHLLHARGLAPGGEKTADLLALARGVALVDVAPCYLAVPHRCLVPGRERRVRPSCAARLADLAREALAGRTPRSAIRWFEHAAGAPHAESGPLLAGEHAEHLA
jgi:hypothetical protein